MKKIVPVLVLIIAGIVAFHAIYEECMYKREVQKVKETITHIAKQYDIPAWIPLSIAQHESGFNPNTVGDGGTSFGLFQLHRGGLAPSHLTDEELKNPEVNTKIAVSHMADSYRKGVKQGLEGLELLRYVANTSGWPGNLGTKWTDENTKYNKGLAESFFAITSS
ncbi:transglycosylase SLT domain-containing protein [Bacillus sp. DX1.1]|uniref:transglycosylase SLT domain-containing protein n=1 Tax=unclassified Bacillus (in: firmicutes) TaxID=185979 RepID=UPI0025712264|nr:MULTISPECIES: transglycosylase SLT domain-containing protein [unclassified Bacillus (in: firmicutes)]MDM5155556.1 transglycosylase SLT domain-containing protein [Bacillus sp. DX1.1]WJE79864.1 transglycosylase SLT domain-containing protein [Bacillus sp. DX3.1]